MPNPPALLVLERDDFVVRVEPGRGFWLRGALPGSGRPWEAVPPPAAGSPSVQTVVLPGGSRVVEAVWPDGTRVVANPGEPALDHAGFRLPPRGFAVDGRTFRAFHLLAGFGQQFQSPSLFVLRSLDGLPLEESTRVAIFRGFGDRAVLVANVHGQMQLRGEVITRGRAGFYVPVEREEEVVFHDWYG